MAGVILDETKKLVRTPGRWRQLLYPRRWRQFFSVLIFNARTGNRWKTAPDGSGFRRREYSSYEQYVRHQQSRLKYPDLAEYDRMYRAQLQARLRAVAPLKKGASVLCLGAWQGTEVKAFHELGCFAVGVDLNPGKQNPLVLPGDFHKLQFPAESADAVFTNSLDHAFDMEKLLGEISRVLKPGGLLIVEAIRGTEEKSEPDQYASFWWKKTDDLVVLLAMHGFKAAQRTPFTEPWPGEQIWLMKEGRK